MELENIALTPENRNEIRRGLSDASLWLYAGAREMTLEHNDVEDLGRLLLQLEAAVKRIETDAVALIRYGDDQADKSCPYVLFEPGDSEGRVPISLIMLPDKKLSRAYPLPEEIVRDGVNEIPPRPTADVLYSYINRKLERVLDDTNPLFVRGMYPQEQLVGDIRRKIAAGRALYGELNVDIKWANIYTGVYTRPD